MSSESAPRDQLADQVLAAIEGQLPKSRRPLLTAFLERILEGLADDDLMDLSISGLAKTVLSFLEWSSQRQPGELLFRLTHPPPEENAWGVHRTVIEVITDDMPFLVDSLTGELNRRNLSVHLFLHPQMSVRRDEEGKLLALLESGEDAGGQTQPESFMHIELDPLMAQSTEVELETALRKILADVRAAVDDWEAMRKTRTRALRELFEYPPPVDDDEIEEARAFLGWIDDHFTFLGSLEYRLEAKDGERYLRPVPESGLGLLRKLPLGEKATGEKPLRPAACRFLDSPRLVDITKTPAKSTVHRRVHMDSIAVKHFNRQGTLLGEHRFLGLFTSRAYSLGVDQIPLVKRKVNRVLGSMEFREGGHDAKVLRYIVEHYPRDELFQISEEDLSRFALRILELQLRPRVALLVRYDEEDRFAFCMVYVPRERHSTQLRERMQKILEEASGGEVTDYFTRITERPLAQVQFVIEPLAGALERIDIPKVEARLTEVTRPWSDHLQRPLRSSRGPAAGLDAWQRYRDAFPAAYQDRCSPEDAARDIEIIEEVLQKNRLGMRLYRREGAAISRLHLRTFELAIPAPLSEILPMLENMGLRVNTEMPFEVRPADAPNPVWVRDFELLVDNFEVNPEEARDRFQTTLAQVWNREVENDSFNRLVLRAGLTWRQVVVLRAYCKYLRQIGTAFSQRYIAQTLAENPQVTRLLVDLFRASHNPAEQVDDPARGETQADSKRQAIVRALEHVQSVDQDRILGAYLNLIRSTLRTNYYQRTHEGEPKPYLALKLDTRKVRGLPPPRPDYEIFVYSPRVEAVHLRGGLVARGGIRWSDRLEDFRTEILGLVKSQMVKNAVIVPVGAKGGFVVKRPPRSSDREEILAEGIACYRTMIQGLLDLTDNLVNDRVVPPKDVVRRDGDDTYLVVAADKGTATFSDIANHIARDYGFWLGDAFASGGSVGYDHKKMGITARGAWESVKRHFREMGRNIQKEPFTTVGVGDMSGDVFGNGMLLSRTTKLVGAFNHLHIFVDPDPDPAASFEERRRLFDLPRSSWADYNREALSPGGDILDRHARSLTVSSQVREFFGLTDTTTTPAELMRAILRAKVDLLWFGGIGTYVKASHESHTLAGDRANDEIRIDATELHARVIGEGANLGLTQGGRVEYALRGGRLNTDFIDNSGGVDCSDHEVNIKIALADAVASGDLPEEDREELLEKMTDSVAELVLHDNYLQTHAISLTEHQRSAQLDEQMRMMRTLERVGLLDRRLEGLPDDATLEERRDRKIGLTRPEIAVLLAHSKIYVYNQLLDSNLPDDSLLLEDLVRYFPTPMQRKYRTSLERHRLRREIIATHVTNSMLNRVGPTFVSRLAEETGARVSDIARAYAAVRTVFDLRSLWEDIEAQDNKLTSEMQMRMVVHSVRMVERATRWFLRHGGRPLDIAGTAVRYEKGIIVVAAQMEELLPTYARQLMRRRLKRMRDNKVPEAVATRVATLDMLHAACDVARSAHATKSPVEHVGRVYFALSERLGFDRLRRAARTMSSDSPWQQTAIAATTDELSSHLADLTSQVVVFPGQAKAAIAAWKKSRLKDVQRVLNLLRDYESAPRIDFPMLILAERELRRLAET